MRIGSAAIRLCTAVILGSSALPVQAQHGGSAGGGLGARAIGLVTHATPALGGESRTEGYVTQPLLMAHASWWALAAHVIVNLEGWTLERGELNASVAGEGYVDRRHPHTYLHEAIAVLRVGGNPLGASIAGGRGFVPFGTDDPMVRPFVKFPANHHLAQVLERQVVMGALRAGPALLEVSTFNGDEPTDPESLGRSERFGDSWSARATLLPHETVEVQVSFADVESPEHAPGNGLDQRKWSASIRFEAERRRSDVYALVEWARTAEYNQGRKVFVFQSFLGEGAVSRGATTAALRIERTTRPEEERLPDPFRAVRPHTDSNIIGVTRWHIASLRLDHQLVVGVRVTPFAEAAVLNVEEITGSIFEPDAFYGGSTMWSLSVGARLEAGRRHGRAGRYGVALSSVQDEHR